MQVLYDQRSAQCDVAPYNYSDARCAGCLSSPRYSHPGNLTTASEFRSILLLTAKLKGKGRTPLRHT